MQMTTSRKESINVFRYNNADSNADSTSWQHSNYGITTS